MNGSNSAKFNFKTGIFLCLVLCIGIAACGVDDATEIPPTPAEAILFNLPPNTLGVVEVEEVVLREEPSIDAAIVGRLNQGAPIFLVAANEDTSWYLVESADGVRGWVFSNFIDREAADAPEATAPVAGIAEPALEAIDTPTDQPTAAAVLTVFIPVTGGGEDETPSPDPTLVPIDTPTNTPTAALTTATLAQIDTPTFTPTTPPGGAPSFDLAFSSDRSGSFAVHLMKTSNAAVWHALPIPDGYNRAWWPSFCEGGWVAVEAQDVGGSDPQWIFVIAPNTGSVDRLDPSVSAQAIGVPRCSPDGSLMAESIKRSGVWGNMIIDDISGSHAELVYQDENFGFTSWALDTDYFYSMHREDNRWEIIRTDNFQSGHGERTRIVRDAKYPSVSPDGDYLVYVCNNSDQLCIRHLPTGQDSVLTDLRFVRVNNQNLPASAVWSADGDWIYYASADGGDWDIFRIRPDGSGRENLTESWTSNEIMPAAKW